MPRRAQRGAAPNDIAAIVAHLDQQVGETATPTLEELFTSEEYFGVTTATPLQRAICRVADGLPLGAALAEHPIVQAGFRSWTDPTLDPDLQSLRTRPRLLCILAATRCGKTRLSGAQAVRTSQTCDLDGLKPGEIPHIPIVSLTRELAQEAFNQIADTMWAKPKLRRLIVGEPTRDTITVRHPSGIPIAIKVMAGSKAGRNLIARWLVGVIFDEAPRMLGSDSGAVVNLSDMLVAIKDRIRGGGQIIEIGSPWAPMGPAYETVIACHGRPSEDTVVVRGKGPWLNPSWWTPERIESLRASDKPEDRLSYRINCEAEFADPEEGLFSSSEIGACTRKQPATLPPERGHHYVGAMDAATRGNAWTVVIKTRGRRENNVVKDVIAVCRQWQGSKNAPLDPHEVFKEIAEWLNPKDPEKPRYNVTYLAADQWSFDAMNSIARKHGLQLVRQHWQGDERTRAYLDAQVKIATGQVELAPDDVLRSDLLAIRKRITQSGINIIEPQTGAGRHCDYAPAFVRALQMPCADPSTTTAESEAERIERRALESDERAARNKRKDANTPWWAQGPFGPANKLGRPPKPPF